MNAVSYIVPMPGFKAMLKQQCRYEEIKVLGGVAHMQSLRARNIEMCLLSTETDGKAQETEERRWPV